MAMPPQRTPPPMTVAQAIKEARAFKVYPNGHKGQVVVDPPVLGKLVEVAERYLRLHGPVEW